MSNNKVANIKWFMPPTTFLSCPGKINVDNKLTRITDKVKSLTLLDSTPRMSLLLRYSSGHGKRLRCILNYMAASPHPKTTSVDSMFGKKIANHQDYLQDIKHLSSQGTGQRLQGLRFKPDSGSNRLCPPPPFFLVSGCWTDCLVLWMRQQTKVPYSIGCDAHRKQTLLGGGLSV